MYMLEAALAVIMMVTALAFVLSRPQTDTDMSKVNYKLTVYNALKISDDVGDLRKNAVENDAAAIKADLQAYVPSTLGFDVAIYNSTSNTTAVPVPASSSDSVITVGYLIAGWSGSYSPREVRAFVWGFD
jgi:hypothetical protein